MCAYAAKLAEKHANSLRMINNFHISACDMHFMFSTNFQEGIMRNNGFPAADIWKWSGHRSTSFRFVSVEASEIIEMVRIGDDETDWSDKQAVAAVLFRKLRDISETQDKYVLHVDYPMARCLLEVLLLFAQKLPAEVKSLFYYDILGAWNTPFDGREHRCGLH